MGVYILTNFNTTIEQDLERIYILRDLGYSPYVMIFNKQEAPKGHTLNQAHLPVALLLFRYAVLVFTFFWVSTPAEEKEHGRSAAMAG